MADLSTNFTLKDAETISIEDTDVDRILILNDIVWEKKTSTQTQITTSSANIGYGDSITLTATTYNTRNNSLLDGTIDFYQKNNNTLKKIATINTSNKKAQYTVSGLNIGTYTYYAIFLQNGKYETSTSKEITVTVTKKTPIMNKTIGETEIYYSWYIGTKLTVDGKSIENEQIDITINGVTYHKITDANGIAKLKIHLDAESLTESKQYTATFTHIDTKTNKYNNAGSYTRTYSINKYMKTDSLPISQVIGIADTYKNAPYQRWEQLDTNSFQCYKNNISCKTTNTIATSAGTYNRPYPLQIYFEDFISSRDNFAGIRFIYSANQTPGCIGAVGGALFSDRPPYITLTVNGNSTTQNGTQMYQNTYDKTGNYCSQGPVSTKLDFIISNYSTNLLTSPIIKIDYPSNRGVEEGCLKIWGVKCFIYYLPKQTSELK